MEGNYIRIQSFSNQLDAEIHKGQLKVNGINALIEKDDCGGMMPNLQLSEGVHLLVKRNEYKAALRILDESAGGDNDVTLLERHPWTCGSCGETLEPQFTDCWRCGATRPE